MNFKEFWNGLSETQRAMLLTACKTGLLARSDPHFRETLPSSLGNITKISLMDSLPIIFSNDLFDQEVFILGKLLDEAFRAREFFSNKSDDPFIQTLLSLVKQDEEHARATGVI